MHFERFSPSNSWCFFWGSFPLVFNEVSFLLFLMRYLSSKILTTPFSEWIDADWSVFSSVVHDTQRCGQSRVWTHNLQIIVTTSFHLSQNGTCKGLNLALIPSKFQIPNFAFSHFCPNFWTYTFCPLHFVNRMEFSKLSQKRICWFFFFALNCLCTLKGFLLPILDVFSEVAFLLFLTRSLSSCF